MYSTIEHLELHVKHLRRFVSFHFSISILFLLGTTNINAQANVSLEKHRMDVIKQYVKFLGNGNYQPITLLFTKDALAISSSGKADNPTHFYKTLFTKTITSPKATLLNLFEDKLDQNMLVAYFDFSWKNLEGKQVSAKFLDLFIFQKNTEKIKAVFVFSNTFQADIMKQLDRG